MATTSYGTPYVQSSDLVSGWPNASLNVANRIDEVSYAGNGINAQTVTSYTLAVTDAGKLVTLNNAAAVAVSLPQDSTANLPVGSVTRIYNLGAGVVTVQAGAGATLQGGSVTVAQYDACDVTKLSANTYGIAAKASIPSAWTAYTPVLTATTTNPTLGSGSVQTGRYMLLGKLVVANAVVSFGTSGVNAGSGFYRVSLPVAASSGNNLAPVGNGWILRPSSGGSWTFQCTQVTSTTADIVFQNGGSGAYAASHSEPGGLSWTTQQSIRAAFIYERD